MIISKQSLLCNLGSIIDKILITYVGIKVFYEQQARPIFTYFALIGAFLVILIASSNKDT